VIDCVVLVAMANNYTNAEMADMHFVYGDTRESCRFYKNGSSATGSQKGVYSAGFIRVSETVEHLY
jgi:hypothetical protein